MFKDRQGNKPLLKCVAVCGDKYRLAMCDGVPVLSYDTMEVESTLYALRTPVSVMVEVSIEDEEEFLLKAELIYKDI